MAQHPFYAPDFSVKIAGLTLAADVRNAVRSLTYDNNIDTADMFTLQLNNADLRFTDSALFDVGKTVEIHLGYVGELQPMMLGEITAVSPSFPEGGAPTLTITGYDKSHRMRHNSPPQKTFKYFNDSLIAAQIAAENGLIPVVDPTSTYSSDWALLQELADWNSFQVYVHWDKLYFRYPRPQTEMVVLEWGKNLSSFTPRLSTSGQVGVEVIRGYDYELAQAIVAILPVVSLDTDLDDIIERLGSSFIDQLVSLGRYVVRGEPVKNYLQALKRGKSILQQLLLEGLYEGSGNCVGMPDLRAGDMIEVRGIGKRFSGKYRLSRVTHVVDEGGYRTSFEVTQKASSLLLGSLRKKLQDTPPPNRQPRMEGVMVGIVRNNIGDPKKLGRVQVVLPKLSEDELSQWAPVASFMAGGTPEQPGNPKKSWGGYFLPDIGDEVLVAFVQGDLNQPVIIGSLWNSTTPPPETNQGPNAKKLIKTKTGMQILFDETPGLENLVIQDKEGNNSVTLDAKPGAESITLKDKAGSTIQMSTTSGDIAISHKAGSTIILKADGTLSLSAPGTVELKSTGGDINLEAANVNVKVTGKMDVS
jgi:phage protein D/phage baseplate assembly protein gpV